MPLLKIFGYIQHLDIGFSFYEYFIGSYQPNYGRDGESCGTIYS
jgi:hypothetical protein